MPTALRVPRLNSNDDVVRVARVLVERGAAVMPGGPVAEVSTDKAAFVVEADHQGVVIDVCVRPGQDVEVGSVLMWLGASADERAPAAGGENTTKARTGRVTTAATLKARALAARGGLAPANISSSRRLSAAEVESHAALARLEQSAPGSVQWPGPEARGRVLPLTPAVQAMCRTVSWHAGAAVPAYVELRYDPRPWEDCAERFQATHGLLLNPRLSLMAWQLARLAAARPELNSTLVRDQRYLYEDVTLGFTVYGGGVLYVVVVHGAQRLSAREFCDRLFDLQRRAAGQTIDSRSLSGVTVAFSSMGRWNVSRHIPVLPPHTSVIVGHTMPGDAEAVLGATYDHRLHTGADLAQLLERLSVPEESLAVT